MTATAARPHPAPVRRRPAKPSFAKHLGSGRCLLIASQDYLYDMGGGTTDTPTAFMTGYLGVAATGSVSDTGGYTRVDGENVYAALADSTLTIPGGYGEYADLLAAGNGGQRRSAATCRRATPGSAA